MSDQSKEARFSYQRALSSLNGAEHLFGLRGPNGTVEKSMERIAYEAQMLLEQARERSNKEGHGRNVGRQFRREQCVRWLENCETFGRPPPRELISLIRYELGVAGKNRDEVKNREDFIAAANFVAKNPGADAAAISRGIGYRQVTVIKKWLNREDFRKEVELERKWIQWEALVARNATKK